MNSSRKLQFLSQVCKFKAIFTFTKCVHAMFLQFFIKGKFHIKKSSWKIPNLHNHLENFFSFGPWLDTLKLDINPKFQVLGSSGTLLFPSFRIGPLDEKKTTTMWKWGLCYVSFYPITLEIRPGKFQKLRNPKILLRKSWELIFQHFLDESSAMTRFQGIRSELIFRVKKMQVQESQVKAVVFFGKSKNRPFIIYTDTFWYFTASYEKIRIKIINFLFFSVKL